MNQCMNRMAMSERLGRLGSSQRLAPLWSLVPGGAAPSPRTCQSARRTSPRRGRAGLAPCRLVLRSRPHVNLAGELRERERGVVVAVLAVPRREAGSCPRGSRRPQSTPARRRPAYRVVGGAELSDYWSHLVQRCGDPVPGRDDPSERGQAFTMSIVRPMRVQVPSSRMRMMVRASRPVPLPWAVSRPIWAALRPVTRYQALSGRTRM